MYFVFWYFACISYFNFEIFKNPQPGTNGTELAEMEPAQKEFYGVQAPQVLRDHIKITSAHTIMLHDAVLI